MAAVFRKAQANAGRVPGTLFGLAWSDVMVTRYFEVFGVHDFAKAARGLLDLSEGRNPVPSTPDGELPARFEYADLIVCSDFALGVPTVGEARGDLASTRAAAPVTGFSTNSSNYSSICLSGPRPAAGSFAPVTSKSRQPTMLLSNTLDPATPVRWAEQVEAQLGARTVHVRTGQIGHGGGMDDPETLRKVREYFTGAQG